MRYNYKKFIQYNRICESISTSIVDIKLEELQDLCSNNEQYKIHSKIIKNTLFIDLIFDGSKSKYLINLDTLDGFVGTKAFKFSSIDDFFDLIEKDMQIDLNLSESIIYFSDKFTEILNKMKSPLSKDILSLGNKDIETNCNYIDYVDEDRVSFLPDSKVPKNPDDSYIVIRKQAYLMPKPKLEFYWKDFGMEMPDEKDISDVSIGETIKLIGTRKSVSNDRVYACIERQNGSKLIVNLNSIEKKQFDESLFLSKGRNGIKIGRLVRSLLTTTNKTFTDKDIENFVNDYKSTVEIINDIFSGISLVSGDDIKKYYNKNSYADLKGTLGDSCMRYEKCSDYLTIYSSNEDVVSLCVLLNDEDKVMARALVWITDQGTFMDRIYSLEEHQVDLLHKYAQSKGWMYKKENSNLTNFTTVYPDGKEEKIIHIVKLPAKYYDQYPYMDSLKFFVAGRLSNKRDLGIYELEDTDGGYDDYSESDQSDQSDENESCEMCNGNGEVECPECDGTSYVSCGECNGTHETECGVCEGSGEIECPECEGNGEVDGKPCTNCDESGMMPCPSCDSDGEVRCGNCDNGMVDCPDC